MDIELLFSEIEMVKHVLNFVFLSPMQRHNLEAYLIDRTSVSPKLIMVENHTNVRRFN